MKIAIYGTGYVGLVTGVCLAELGHDVLCLDIDTDKIAALEKGIIPIYEPGLEILLEKNKSNGQLKFSSDLSQGVAHGFCQFIAVGTPSGAEGAANLEAVFSVVKTIASHMTDYRLIINKSTVPVGAAVNVKTIIHEVLTSRQANITFDVASNPEFLREGSAVKDFLQPSRIVIGVDSSKASDILRDVYQPLQLNPEKLLMMDIASAELSKYAANAMLATRISFMNEMANFAEKVQADIGQLKRVMASDPRIGSQFLEAGCGYGGSCLPKDVNALIHVAQQHDYQLSILQAVEKVNQAQQQVLFTKFTQHFAGKLQGRSVALWGLAFKPNTDDMRAASSQVLLERLWQAGVTVRAYDPVAMEQATQIYGERDNFILCQQPEECLIEADALFIVTEWPQFQNPDFATMKARLRESVIFDGRNIYQAQTMRERGFTYYGIGTH